MINLSSRARLIVLVLAIGALAFLIAWAARTSWLEVREVRGRFGVLDRTAFPNDPGRLRALIFSVTEALTTYEVTDRAEDRAELERRQREMGAWMVSTKASLDTVEEKALFQELEVAYGNYLTQTRKLADANPIDEPKDVMIARFATIQSAANELFALAARLTSLRRAMTVEFVRASEKSVATLQQMIFASMFGLVLLTAWGMRIVYRDTIAPLKLKLIETHEIAERQEKLASLGVLAAGVAHEIRNPLTAIKARLFTQKKALAAGTSAYHDGEFIAAEITRLERIVRDFLSFARPSPSRRENISVSELLDRLRELLEQPLREAGINLAVEETPDLRIEGDAEQLQQVLINLVRNAADSIEEKGHVTLRARSDIIALSENVRDVVVLEVEDDGKGIPAEVQERLFDPFFSTKSDGTGLGLSIAARIVEQHGGALQYQTQVGRGTTFGLILPRKIET